MYDLKMLEEIKSQEERIHFSSFDYNDAYTDVYKRQGYVDALTAQIVVAEGVDEPEVTFVPVVKSLEYKEAGFFMSPANYYICLLYTSSPWATRLLISSTVPSKCSTM